MSKNLHPAAILGSGDRELRSVIAHGPWVELPCFLLVNNTPLFIILDWCHLLIGIIGIGTICPLVVGVHLDVRSITITHLEVDISTLLLFHSSCKTICSWRFDSPVLVLMVLEHIHILRDLSGGNFGQNGTTKRTGIYLVAHCHVVVSECII